MPIKPLANVELRNFGSYLDCIQCDLYRFGLPLRFLLGKITTNTAPGVYPEWSAGFS